MKIVSRCWNSVTSVKVRRSPMGSRWDCRRKTTNTTSSVWLSAIDRPRKRQGPPKLQCRWARPFVPSDNDPFAEFIVHEVAHVFHNCKRATVGLHETRTKQRLLDIDYRKRETFAYACEAYARVFERGKRPAERLALAGAYGRAVRLSDERVDAGEIASIVREAAAASNGRKVILTRCAPTRRKAANSSAA
jgi:hypothetical protein